MWIGCVETIRTFQYIFLMFSAAAFVTETSKPATIKYTCSNDGVELTDDSDVSHVAIPVGTSSSRTYCRPQTKDLNPCKNPQNKLSMSVLYEDESTKNVIGGKTIGFFKLTCTNLPKNVTRNTVVYTAISEPSNEKTETDTILSDFSLVLKLNDQKVLADTKINIGDTLQLQMIGKDVEISPIRCIAYPENDKKSKVTIWRLHTEFQGEKNCVNEDSAIIETPKWSQITTQDPSISINIYAFRFLNNSKVAIECEATLCAKGDQHVCKQTCVIPKTRKRRSIRDIIAKENSKLIGSASVSFEVTENKPLDNSSPGLSVGFMKIATVGVILACLL